MYELNRRKHVVNHEQSFEALKESLERNKLAALKEWEKTLRDAYDKEFY